MKKMKVLDEENLSDEFFWNNPIPMWIYGKWDKRILEVNNAAVDVYGYSKLEFRNLFNDDFIGDDLLTDFPDDSESELVKQLSIHRISDGSSFVTLTVENPVTFNNEEAMLVRSIKVFN